jgi:hypothetical protein
MHCTKALGLRVVGGAVILREAKAGSAAATGAAIVRDPDGHALKFLSATNSLAGN